VKWVAAIIAIGLVMTNLTSIPADTGTAGAFGYLTGTVLMGVVLYYVILWVAGKLSRS
jgi:hypothetical protein